MASLRAMLAVIGSVVAALVGAGFAGLCAQGTEFIGQRTLASHQGCREPAHVCAIPVQLYAVRHHLNILLLQAG